nr:histidine kinase [Thalassotalea sp. G2M2-11]
MLHIDFLVYLSVFGVGYAISYYNNAKKQADANQQLAKQLVEVELNSLRSQLNPHFLFNTLNTISSLISLDEKNTAVKALSELSAMLRKVLENQQTQLIPIRDELEFIHSYLSIQKMRFEEKLSLEINVNDKCTEDLIPFMLLQPLVENAVQHSSQLETDHNAVKLIIECDEQHILIRLINKFTHKDKHKGFGIGITNTKERLKKLYDENAQLTLTHLSDDYFETLVSLPRTSSNSG